MVFARIGSILYIIWGILHLIAAYQGFVLGDSLEPGLVLGKINQGAWDLLFIADIGFVVFVLMPGHVDLMPGILGPVFWISAAIFSSLGLRAKTTH